MSAALQFALFCGCAAGLCWLALRTLGALKRTHRPSRTHDELEGILEEAGRTSRDPGPESGPR